MKKTIEIQRFTYGTFIGILSTAFFLIMLSFNEPIINTMRIAITCFILALIVGGISFLLYLYNK